ncbi:hypothetical protein ABZ208_32925 [Streptomyces sp. NPDC006208]|uniref:hypothetical protein n=1 Tax=Streptomyces sp. NPDC006208 TaxID=3156734 RepID=UPI0033A0A15F
MSNFKERVCVTIASTAVAGGAVVGAGGAASAATSTSGHAQRPTVNVEADDRHSGRVGEHSWDRDDGHRRDQGTTSS